jgi:hypothetical protein
LIESGWQIKQLHREIMLSATWQQSTRRDGKSVELDPRNRLLWRANRRRMEAEAVRDSLLVVSGDLDHRMGGTLLTTPNRKYVTSTANVNPVVYESHRRSLYLPVVRSALYEVFQAFDFADPSALTGKRQSTTVAPQALFMMNSRFVSERARSLAQRLLDDNTLDDRDRIQQLYLDCYARPARPHEVQRALDFVDKYSSRATGGGEVRDASDIRLKAWQSLCRAVVAANEFIFVE